ncbi:MAG: ATP-binding protein [Rhodobacter sp.]|nr:ATP-binding protein [Rhodobacter sp.]
MPARIHLICGLTGAGKTTYAESLRRDLAGVRFSIDDWNARLFFMDREPTSDFNWFYERVQRSCAQMRDTAEQVLEAGIAAVFDCGFTDLKERTIFYDWAQDIGRPVTLHFLDVARETRWARVQQRNTERGATFAIEVTPQMFDFMETIWQAPDAAEVQGTGGEFVVV